MPLGLLNLVAAGSATYRLAAFEPLLFLDLNDTTDGAGLMWPRANTVAPNASFKPPPHLPFAAGSLVIATIPSQARPGVFEVYAENTTGWEPLPGQLQQGSGFTGGSHDCALLRFTTTDFVEYSDPHTAALALDVIKVILTPPCIFH